MDEAKELDLELLELKSQLLGSLLLFTKVFFKKRTGRDFYISQPVSRESHFITVCRELTKVFNLEAKNLFINIPPGHGKSELCKHFVAWALAHYPDSNFLYISYAHELAARHTHGIKQIMEMPLYKNLFNVRIRQDSSAKDRFMTEQGGTVAAFGSQGAITGNDAGLPNLDRFSGCALMDDMHKPDEVHSDTIRENVIKNYNETIKQRRRGINVPFIGIGQRLHENDLFGFLMSGQDGNDWKKVILPALDEHNNPLYPEKDTLEMLLKEKQFNPYVFASQYMQNPQPAGGGIFNPEWFYLMDETPEMLSTFITVDTAETDKTYNDATVFSFWGLYKINANQTLLENNLAIHWIDCIEIRVEPKDLEPEFNDFYQNCLLFKKTPQVVAIEKKSTGATLISLIKEKRTLKIIELTRTATETPFKSKIDRFMAMQPFVASGKVSLPRYGKHTKMCLEHMRKITANNSHRFDDIADTLFDAVKIGLMDKGVLLNISQNDAIVEQRARKIYMEQKRLNTLRERAYYGR